MHFKIKHSIFHLLNFWGCFHITKHQLCQKEDDQWSSVSFYPPLVPQMFLTRGGKNWVRTRKFPKNPIFFRACGAILGIPFPLNHVFCCFQRRRRFFFLRIMPSKNAFFTCKTVFFKHFGGKISKIFGLRPKFLYGPSFYPPCTPDVPYKGG